VPALFAGIKNDFPDKPILAVNPLGYREMYRRMSKGFQEIGIPSYANDEDAIASLAAMCRYQQYLLHDE